MNNAEKKDLEDLDRAFVSFFFMGLIFSFFFIYFAGTFGGIPFIQPIMKEPFLLFMATVTLSFFIAVVNWREEQKKIRKREGKF